MRRVLFALAAAAAALAAGTDASAAAFTGKPPMIGDSRMLPQAVTYDASGNQYVIGSFFQTADFDPSSKIQNRTAHGLGGSEVFVTKFDPAGKWLWTQTFGGTGNDTVAAVTVGAGSVFVVGTFESNNAGFGTLGSISAHYDASNFGAGYILALDLNTGAPRTTFNGTGAQVFGTSGGGRAFAKTVLVSGTSVYVGGSFTGSGFGVGGSGALSSAGQADGFIVAVDTATGTARLGFSGDGAQSFAGNGNESVESLAFANGVLYAGGSMSSTDFGIGGTGSVSSGAQFNVDAFVAAIQSNNGGPVTAFGGDAIVRFGGTGEETCHGITLSGSDLFATGTANGSDAKIDGTGPAFPNIGGRDVYVMALNATSGAPDTAFANGVRMFGSTANEDEFTGIVAAGGNVYVAGQLGAIGAGVGAAGNVEQADSFVLALAQGTGLAPASFGGDGVQTLTGGDDPDMHHQTAQILGLAVSPRGLAITGSVVGKAFADSGVYKAYYPGGGAHVTLLDPVSGDTQNMNANRRPEFTAPPVATPNPVVAGKPVKIRAVCSDPDHDKLKFSWHLDDGSVSTAKSPKKIYAMEGQYGVDVTATDAKGASAQSSSLELYVVAAGTPYFDVAKVTIALKFSVANADAITVSGQFPLADGTSLDGKTFTVDVGGLTKSFTLDAAGRSPKGDESVAVTPPKSGVAKFTVKLTHGSYAAPLAGEGLTDATVAGRYAPVVVQAIFDSTGYTETYQLFWSAKQGKSGTAK